MKKIYWIPSTIILIVAIAMAIFVTSCSPQLAEIDRFAELIEQSLNEISVTGQTYTVEPSKVDIDLGSLTAKDKDFKIYTISKNATTPVNLYICNTGTSFEVSVYCLLKDLGSFSTGGDAVNVLTNDATNIGVFYNVSAAVLVAINSNINDPINKVIESFDIEVALGNYSYTYWVGNNAIYFAVA